MKQTALRWIVVLAAMLVAGPIAGAIVGSITGADGSVHATALASDAPLSGLLRTAAAVVLAIGFGTAASTLCGPRVGMVGAGLVLAWGAWAGGRLDELVRQPETSGLSMRLALESLLLGVLVIVGAGAISKAGRRRNKDEADPVLSQQGAMGFIVAVVAGGIAAYVFARSEAVGQTFAAGIAAGLVGAVVGRSVANRAAPLVFVAAGVGLAAAGHAAAGLSGADLRSLVYSNAIFPLARLTPLDWMSGVLVGVPLGVAWASSMVEKHAPAAASAGAATA